MKPTGPALIRLQDALATLQEKTRSIAVEEPNAALDLVQLGHLLMLSTSEARMLNPTSQPPTALSEVLSAAAAAHSEVDRFAHDKQPNRLGKAAAHVNRILEALSKWRRDNARIAVPRTHTPDHPTQRIRVRRRSRVDDESDKLTLPECVMCAHKQCRKAPVWVLGICEYGISFVNDGQAIQRANASGTLRHLAQNLRHELNKVLQIVISEACRIDPTVSAKRIEPTKPASKIVGAALVIDHFVNMISGVNDLHAEPGVAQHTRQPTAVKASIEQCLRIFGIIINTQRASSLRMAVVVAETLQINYASPIVDYMIAVLVDNIYKHALDGSLVSIRTENVRKGLADLIFENDSKPLLQPDRIFAKGYQENKSSDGFGFGLFWSQILADHYNAGLDEDLDPFMLVHEQDIVSVDYGIARQRFTIKNIRLCSDLEDTARI